MVEDVGLEAEKRAYIKKRLEPTRRIPYTPTELARIRRQREREKYYQVEEIIGPPPPPAKPEVVTPEGVKVYRGEEVAKREAELSYQFQKERLTRLKASHPELFMKIAPFRTEWEKKYSAKEIAEKYAVENPEFRGPLEIVGTGQIAVITDIGVRLYPKDWLKKLTVDQAYEIGAITPQKYAKIMRERLRAIERFYKAKRKFEKLLKEDPFKALRYARDEGLITRTQYKVELDTLKRRKRLGELIAAVEALSMKYLPAERIPEYRLPEWIRPEYTVITKKPDGTEETFTFPSLKAAKTYVETARKEQMARAGWTKTWDEFVAHNRRVADVVSKLIAKGTAKIDEAGRLELTKPVAVLTDEEIRLAREAGFDIPDLPPGPSWIFYKWAKERAKETGNPKFVVEGFMTAKESHARTAALLDAFTDPALSIYQFLVSAIPGEQLGERGFRRVTKDTVKYLVDLTPAQRADIVMGGTIASALGAYVTALPLGFTAKGITLAAKAIGSKIGATTPAAVSKIAAFLKTHPKAMQAIVWAPIAGVEAHHVYQSIKAGRPVEDILTDEAYRIAALYGGMAGFRKGWTLFPTKKMAKLTRLMDIETVQTKKGPVQVPVLKEKDIPEKLRPLFQAELDPITGKEILVGRGIERGKVLEILIKKGFTKAEAQNIFKMWKRLGWDALVLSAKSEASLYIAREYGDLLGDLVQGKIVGPEAIKQGIVDAVGPQGYDLLVARGLDIKRMSAEEIAKFMFRELGYGTPWYKPPMEWVMPRGRFEVVGVMTPLEGDSLAASVKKTRELFHYLMNQGMSAAQATKWATEIMTASPTKLVFMAQTAGLSEETVQTILRASLTYGAMTAGGTSLYQTLTKAGVKTQEVKTVMPILLQTQTTATLVKNLPKLSAKATKVVVPMLDKAVLREAIPKLDSKTLTNVVPALDRATAIDVIPRLSSEKLVKVGPSLSPDVLNAVAPRLDARKLSSLVSKLTGPQIESLVQVVPQLSLEQLAALVPVLSQVQLQTVLQTTTYTTPEILYTIELLFPIFLPQVEERIKRAKRVPRTRFLEPYKVTFRYYGNMESHKVRARSFREALILGYRLKKSREKEVGVDVKKIIKRRVLR